MKGNYHQKPENHLQEQNESVSIMDKILFLNNNSTEFKPLKLFDNITLNLLEQFTLLLALCSEYQRRRRRITETVKVVEKVFGEKEREKGNNFIELN